MPILKDAFVAVLWFMGRKYSSSYTFPGLVLEGRHHGLATTTYHSHISIESIGSSKGRRLASPSL